MQTFKLDLEELKVLNGENSTALFKYLKRVSKNKTPVILQGTKVNDHWNCKLTECAIPASSFGEFKLPATEDKNPDGTKLFVQLTEDLISQFTDWTTFTFRDQFIEIVRENLKIKKSYTATALSLEEQLEDFQELLDRKEVAKASIKINKSSELLNILKELKASPTASVFVTKDSITLWKDLILYRVKNTEDCTIADDATVYINMYLANTILGMLDYTETVELTIGESNTVVAGYEADGKELVKNISAIYPCEAENPTDEDLESICPNPGTCTIINLDLQEFVSSLESQKNAISVFTSSRNWEARLCKNGEGLSLSFEKAENRSDSAIVTINIGDTVSTEPAAEEFTDYRTVLPVDLIENVFKDNLTLRIVFDSDNMTSVVFESGNARILSGKLL